MVIIKIIGLQCCLPDDPTVSKSRCCSVSSECDPISLPIPPGPPSSRRPPPSGTTDFEGLSEKYWGEILERTVSSNSLHALQRVYGQPAQKNNIMELNGRIEQSVSLSNISNSEPKLCEHYQHDVNCAKSKAYFNGRHTIKGLPDI